MLDTGHKAFSSPANVAASRLERRTGGGGGGARELGQRGYGPRPSHLDAAHYPAVTPVFAHPLTPGMRLRGVAMLQGEGEKREADVADQILMPRCDDHL